MYNGSHANGTLSSTGTYYNARVSNALTAIETIVTKDYVYNICPKNWTLPIGQQFKTVNNYSSDFNIVYAGDYDRGAPNYTTRGYWWSRTATSSTGFYYAYAVSGVIDIYSVEANVHFGFPVRCLSK